MITRIGLGKKSSRPPCARAYLRADYERNHERAWKVVLRKQTRVSVILSTAKWQMRRGTRKSTSPSDILLILRASARIHNRKRNAALFFRLIFMKATAHSHHMNDLKKKNRYALLSFSVLQMRKIKRIQIGFDYITKT